MINKLSVYFFHVSGGQRAITASIEHLNRPASRRRGRSPLYPLSYRLRPGPAGGIDLQASVRHGRHGSVPLAVAFAFLPSRSPDVLGGLQNPEYARLSSHLLAPSSVEVAARAASTAPRLLLAVWVSRGTINWRPWRRCGPVSGRRERL